MDTAERIEIQESMKPCKLGHHRRYLDVVSGACTECQRINEGRGRTKPQSKREFRPTGQNGAGYMVTGDSIDPKDFAAHLLRIQEDPVRFAQFMAEGRRPGNVSRAAYGIATRRAVREPMLNANPRETQKALEGKHHVPRNARLDKDKPFKRIVVKPNSSITGKNGWYERLWTIHHLRYSRGIVGVTDEGEETLVFPDWFSMRKSIVGSGWQIIREEVPQGGNRK